MFRFTAEGRIGRLERAKGNPGVARLSVTAPRYADHQNRNTIRLEWLACVCFDATLTDRIMRDLSVGDRVTLEGRIEPRPRQLGDLRIIDHTFVVTGFRQPQHGQSLDAERTASSPGDSEQGACGAGQLRPRNQILNGDCTRLMRDLPSACVDFILTDPPYLVRYRGRDGRTVINDDREDWLHPAFAEMHRVLKNNAFCVSFYGWGKADRFLDAWRAAGFRTVGHIIFRKRYASSVRYLRYEHEQAYLLAKGAPPPPETPVGDVIDFPYTGNRLHPTQKPVEALTPLIKTFSAPGDLVLDPFCGSGSTLIAARMHGRAYLGMDVDPTHCATARARVENELHREAA